MKSNQAQKKLQISKKTIASLSVAEKNSLIGGALPTTISTQSEICITVLVCIPTPTTTITHPTTTTLL